ncbi:MAG TPA: hypothetical protein GXX75_05245 [Clostridiales bacterium]|nr:hypothetical protein [Clostridiales bacterium]
MEGCGFVVISILPGTFDEMNSDVHLSERLRIYQSVGDTADPGSIILDNVKVRIDNSIKDYVDKDIKMEEVTEGKDSKNQRGNRYEKCNICRQMQWCWRQSCRKGLRLSGINGILS